MLLEFKVKNFRSFKDEQTLRLAASRDRSSIHKDLAKTNVHKTGGDFSPRVLSSAVVMGANASGKSNLIFALQCMRSIILGSAHANMKDHITPFLFDDETAVSPTEFEATIMVDGVRYQYGFSITPERVVHERLNFWPAVRRQTLFERRFNEKSKEDKIKPQDGLKGPKKSWKEATRPDALFLSVATMLNSQDFKPVFEWFAKKCIIFNEHRPQFQNYTAKSIGKKSVKQEILSLMNSADISIKDISVEKKKFTGHAINIDADTGEAELEPDTIERQEVTFHHQGTKRDIAFGMDQESAGTRVLFALAGPILNILKTGQTLIVDELDRSLHPILLKELVWLFHDPELNTGAQLIFSAHDATLLDTVGLFRPDQIWLTDKRKDMSTKLYSFEDFSMSEIRNMMRNYLGGRYGGTPFVDFDQILRS